MSQPPTLDEIRATHAKLFPDEPPLNVSRTQLALMGVLSVTVMLGYIAYRAPIEGAKLLARGLVLAAKRPVTVLRLAGLGAVGFVQSIRDGRKRGDS